MDTNQKTRFSEVEMELIKGAFIEEKILYAIRKVFFQFELTDDDKALLATLTPEMLAIVRKFFLPELVADVPLLQEADLYFALGKIKEINPAVAALHIAAKDLEIAFLTQQFNVLSGAAQAGADGEIKLVGLKAKGEKTDEERVVTMLAYLSLTNAFIDSCLNGIKTLANQKVETPEEAAAKAAANSSK